MGRYRIFQVLLLLTLAAASGCASVPAEKASPSEANPLSQARESIAQARASGYNVDDATIFLHEAEHALTEGDNRTADEFARKAQEAVRARKAIEAAKPAIARARTAGVLSGDAGAILEAAEAALKAGDPVRAEELANQVHRQAEDSLEQKKSPKANVGGAE